VMLASQSSLCRLLLSLLIVQIAARLEERTGIYQLVPHFRVPHVGNGILRFLGSTSLVPANPVLPPTLAASGHCPTSGASKYFANHGFDTASSARRAPFSRGK
jgi:hypothetical protein